MGLFVKKLQAIYYLRRHLASGEGIVSLGVTQCVCLSVEPRLHSRRVSLGGEGNYHSRCQICTNMCNIYRVMSVKRIQNGGRHRLEFTLGVNLGHMTCFRSHLLTVRPNFANLSQLTAKLFGFVEKFNMAAAGRCLVTLRSINFSVN